MARAATIKPTAKPERLHGHLEPTPDGSVYVNPAAMQWKPSQFEGIEIKVLYEDKTRGEMTCLLKWQPGTTLPFHKHPEIEQSYVLSPAAFCCSCRAISCPPWQNACRCSS